MFGEKIHRYIYLFGLILLVVSLPLSKLTLSISQFVLMGNWLLEGKFREKYKLARNNIPLLVFEIIYFVHVVGLLYTSNFQYGFLSLKLKLPLLLIPILIATTKPLSLYDFKLIIRFFIAGVFASALIGTLGFFNILNLQVSSVREISLFIPHISLALLVNIAIYFSFFNLKNEKPIYLAGQVLAAGLLIIFLFILKSLTGIIAFFIVLYFLIFNQLVKSGKRKKLYISIMSVIPVLLFLYLSFTIKKYFDTEPFELKDLPKQTINGNPYYHDIKSQLQENGNYVYVYVCDKELRKEWSRISQLDYDSLDLQGNELKHTLIRYLASIGVNKDSVGIQKLTQKDIALIENGYSNYLYAKKFGFQSKIAEVSWQISLYKENGDFQWNSVVQRYIAYKTGLQAFSKKPLLGYGTGDLEDAFIEAYQKTFGEFKKYAFSIGVNQFLSFLVGFGIVGVVLLLFAIFYPAYVLKGFHNYYFFVFIIIALVGMFSEEMLKFQSGATIFAFFYSFLLFGRKDILDEKQG